MLKIGYLCKGLTLVSYCAFRYSHDEGDPRQNGITADFVGGFFCFLVLICCSATNRHL